MEQISTLQMIRKEYKNTITIDTNKHYIFLHNGDYDTTIDPENQMLGNIYLSDLTKMSTSGLFIKKQLYKTISNDVMSSGQISKLYLTILSDLITILDCTYLYGNDLEHTVFNDIMDTLNHLEAVSISYEMFETAFNIKAIKDKIDFFYRYEYEYEIFRKL